MIKNWLSFKIYLPDILNFLNENIPNSDGIIATEENFIIVEKNQFTEYEVLLINNYLDSLTYQLEQEKFNRPIKLQNATINLKNNLINKSYDIMTNLEKKILLSIPLTKDEEDTIISNY